MIGGSSPTGTLELRRAKLTVQLVNKKDRDEAPSSSSRPRSAKSSPASRTCATYRQRTRRARTDGRHPRRDGAAVNAGRLRAAERHAEGSDLPEPDRRRRARPPGDPHHSRGSTRRPISASPRRSISEAIRIATIGDNGANLCEAQRWGCGRSRSASSWRWTRGRTWRRLPPSRCRPRAEPPFRSRPSRISEFAQGPSSIERWNRERRVTVGTAMASGHATGEGIGSDDGPAGGEEPAARGPHPVDGRHGDPGGGVRRLRAGHGRRHHDGVRRADPAARQRVPADHHPRLAAALGGGRGARAAGDAEPGLHAGRDRHPDAHGHRDEERDHARRLRRRGGEEGHPADGPPSSTPAASARGRSS